MQIILFLLVTVLIVFIFSLDSETLSKKAKIFLLLGIGIVVLAGWFYEASLLDTQERKRAIVSAFEQGKTITCKDINVTSKEFLFSSGTSVFVPLGHVTHFKGVVIDVLDCKIDQ
ncbi:MAG: hypothetical protein PHW07_05375 [Sulfurospirillaceae bacterium]|nr:hypothetical protein [Sulfurospirillaceae bacterium]